MNGQNQKPKQEREREREREREQEQEQAQALKALAPKQSLAALGLSKTFTLHLSGPAQLKALDGVDLSVGPKECLGLTGPSGSGKSSLLRCLYGNYRLSSGDVILKHEDSVVTLSKASDRLILAIRVQTIGYVSQFLRVIPRVATLDIVSEPLLTVGWSQDRSHKAAGEILDRLRIPKKLWSLPPATFSGGEKQRVNLARVFVKAWPILLLDEPTASLDAKNRDSVCSLIIEAKERGSAIVGVFHDLDFLNRVADSQIRLSPPRQAS
ncbi:MAG: phosphonate C-P lyase system protein PhnL [Deltaproteobacteria bacterium]|jgi:alpha-D-ribose 1-methylphosphonate 5-triphosphate synthase subunit PhnL|nr:phosphonate C-P lyase system protein PhnL [Deltaproteobacteria bacterium]